MWDWLRKLLWGTKTPEATGPYGERQVRPLEPLRADEWEHTPIEEPFPPPQEQYRGVWDGKMAYYNERDGLKISDRSANDEGYEEVHAAYWEAHDDRGAGGAEGPLSNASAPADPALPPTPRSLPPPTD